MTRTSKFILRTFISLVILLPFIVLTVVWWIPRSSNASKESQNNSVLTEALRPDDSTNQDLWLKSGGQISLNNGEMQSIQGKLSSISKIRKAYLRTNPLDTDNGYHPQNILKLFTRAKYTSSEQEIHFFIDGTNLSTSPNRNAKNGVMLISSYVAPDSYYYAGLQVDGKAVIGKRNGNDITNLSEENIYGYTAYDRDTNPNIIPEKTWIGIKMITKSEGGITEIKLYGDLSGTGEWQLLTEATDTSNSSDSGLVGVWSNFMDISFSQYKII